MHPVITFGAPTPASSVSERGITVIRHYPAKLLELLKVDLDFCTPPRKTPDSHSTLRNAHETENPDVGLECKAFPSNSGNILQKLREFLKYEIHVSRP
ncbi:hypothetical protein TNCV_2866891 [Trichonephila clavipes]|nr:hypothetical protein TNCV_2866891 [Trichonephila clavipes]